MLIQSLMLGFIFFISIVLSALPTVTTLPPMLGVDIDAALVSGMGFYNTVSHSFWMLADVMAATIILMGYYGIKNLLLRFFLGHRAP